MMSTDTRLAALLLTNRLTRVEATPLRASEFWAIVESADAANIELGSLLGAQQSVLDSLADASAGIDPQRLQHLLGATRALAFEVERLGEGGIRLISALCPEFPGLVRDRLQHSCPPSLFVAGPLDWLQGEALAIVGSDDAPSESHDIARSAVAAAVVADWAIVADNTAIGDATVAESLACGGRVVVVPSVGINRAARLPATRKLVQEGTLCLASPYAPDAQSSPAAERARDMVVHALGHTTFVTSTPDGLGATWAAARQAAQREPASVATWLGDGSQAGNIALAELGAQGIETISDLYKILGTG